jgi:hypothetical protein
VRNVNRSFFFEYSSSANRFTGPRPRRDVRASSSRAGASSSVTFAGSGLGSNVAGSISYSVLSRSNVRSSSARAWTRSSSS